MCFTGRSTYMMSQIDYKYSKKNKKLVRKYPKVIFQKAVLI